MHRLLSLILFLCVFPVFGDEQEELNTSLRHELEAFDQYNSERSINKIRKLLEAGADPNQYLHLDMKTTLLMGAVSTGFVELTEMFLEHGAEVDDVVTNYGESALYNAIGKMKAAQLVRLLLRYGANPNQQDDKGQTPLIKLVTAMIHFSVDEVELAETLLSYGADPNLPDYKGYTALMYYLHRNKSLFKYILEAGADPNQKDNEGNTVFTYFPESVKDIPYYRECLGYLFQAGADPTIKDSSGRTALHLLSHWIDKTLFEQMISLGCQPDEPDKEGVTPIMRAARRCNDEVILGLLEKRADPNCKDASGKNVLYIYLVMGPHSHRHYTEYKSYSPLSQKRTPLVPVVQALLAAGARPADKDEQGDSALIAALYLARRFPDMEPLRELIIKYADDDEIKEATKIAYGIIRDENIAKLGKNFKAVFLAMIIPLLIAGLSMGMREGVYRKIRSENFFMGLLNGILTIGTGSLFLGGFIGYEISNSNNMRLAGIGYLFYGGVFGAIGGVILACFPPVRRAFTENVFLYYTPTVASFITGLYFVSKIF